MERITVVGMGELGASLGLALKNIRLKNTEVIGHCLDRKTGSEIDKIGDNDYNINFDKIETLPFKNHQFTYCLLNDVLEHLESFHQILNESFRVTKKILVISLPIPSNEFMNIIKNRKYKGPLKNAGIYNKFYGLPNSVPEDRHRWWFTYDDVISFFEKFDIQM